LTEIYLELSEVQSTFGPLKKLCFLLNQPTDLMTRMKVNAERRSAGKDRREAARQQVAIDSQVTGVSDNSVFACDKMDIEFDNVTFVYPSHKTVLLNSVSQRFPQGKMYALVGLQHQGKATILKLLGQVVVPEPDKGWVFTPPHLRVLHLSREVSLLDDNLYHNIVFNFRVDKLGGPKRVKRICERVGFSPKMLRLLDLAMGEEEAGIDHSEEDDYVLQKSWASRLSETDYARLNLARVLVMNPECCVMHLPFIAFEDSTAREMVHLVKQHIEEKGLELPPEERKYRRPRTVFFTSSSLSRCDQADMIFEVSKERGLLRIQAA